MTLYALKPRFQAQLRPLAHRLARAGITANQVTVGAMGGSLALGALLSFNAELRWPFAVLPLWLFVRMGLNAIDGMMARECGQESRLGAVLNEVGDVVSDAALILPLCFLAPFTPFWVGAVIFLIGLSELSGLLAQTRGGDRCYDGPLGKADRALVLGLLGLWIGFGGGLPAWLFWLLPAVAVLLTLTCLRRLWAGEKAAERAQAEGA